MCHKTKPNHYILWFLRWWWFSFVFSMEILFHTAEFSPSSLRNIGSCPICFSFVLSYMFFIWFVLFFICFVLYVFHLVCPIFHLFCNAFLIFKAYCFGFSILTLWCILLSTTLFSFFNHPISLVFAPNCTNTDIWNHLTSFATIHCGLSSWMSFMMLFFYLNRQFFC